jgi:hypothetical protein
MRSRRFPALGRSATELSVTDSYLCRSGDEFNMRFRVPQWLVNIAHFSKLSGGRETAPARGELRPSSEGSPFVDGDPCRTKTPSGHSFHSEIRTACHEKYFSCRISVPGVEQARPKRIFFSAIAVKTFIGWRATSTRHCFGKASRRRRLPICHSQRAAERDSVRVFASFPDSVLDSQSQCTQSVPGAWYKQGQSLLNTEDCHEQIC